MTNQRNHRAAAGNANAPRVRRCRPRVNNLAVLQMSGEGSNDPPPPFPFTSLLLAANQKPEESPDVTGEGG